MSNSENRNKYPVINAIQEELEMLFVTIKFEPKYPDFAKKITNVIAARIDKQINRYFPETYRNEAQSCHSALKTYNDICNKAFFEKMKQDSKAPQEEKLQQDPKPEAKPANFLERIFGQKNSGQNKVSEIIKGKNDEDKNKARKASVIKTISTVISSLEEFTHHISEKDGKLLAERTCEDLKNAMTSHYGEKGPSSVTMKKPDGWRGF